MINFAYFSIVGTKLERPKGDNYQNRLKQIGSLQYFDAINTILYWIGGGNRKSSK